MTMRGEPFALEKWYHCYNISIEGRPAFVDSRDYYRFLELIYLANDDLPLRRDEIRLRTFEEVMKLPRSKPLVSIAAFSLLPDHFHLALKMAVEGGITTFMRKLGTAYTLYFNSRHNRVGNLFLKPFKSLPAPTERNVSQMIHYIHCSPATLIEPRWKSSPVADPQFLGEHVTAHPYSSLGIYRGAPMHTRAILSVEALAGVRTLPIQKMLQEARLYASDHSIP